MDERELHVLGLLKSESMHGYQINEFIDKFLGKVLDMKKATAYAILKRLLKKGYVDLTLHQEGNRSVRQVYSITDNGEAFFTAQLKHSLAQAEDISLPREIGIMFLDYFPLPEVIMLFKKREQKVEKLIQFHHTTPEK